MQSDISCTSSAISPVGLSRRPALTRAELRTLVRHWVGMLKEAGFPPEEVLIAVKSLVRETIVPRYSELARCPPSTAMVSPVM